MTHRKALLLVLAFGIISTIPFLGLAEFNTKGEPRESVVALSMLQNGDWILPTNNGGEYAYKPPFFHWCIAAVSQVAGGVSLFSSRLPSAVAAILMMTALFCFFSVRKNTVTALLASLMLMTFFEVHRAAFACRVDMMLSALTVLSLFRLYKWHERGMHGISLSAVLLMGLAALTKGPVGIILPCLVMGIFALMRGEKFLKTLLKYTATAIAACILPALWYWAAYQRGGETFLDLVMEENFGRFTGKMSYESHEQPLVYNFMTILAGTLPWTLLCLVSLFFIKREQLAVTNFKGLFGRIRRMEPYNLFAFLAIVVIFAFYCIPKSKRSVYLLPVYPFIAWYMAVYAQYLAKTFPKGVRIFGWIAASLGFALLLAFSLVKYGFIPDDVCGTGRHASENLAYLRSLESIPLSPLNLVMVLLPAWAIWKFVRINAENRTGNSTLFAICGIFISIYISLDGVYQPAVLSSKTDRHIAEEISAIAGDVPVTSYVKAPMLHFFGINWYLDDAVGVFDPEKDRDGYIIAGDKDSETMMQLYGSDFVFEEVYRSGKRSCDVKQTVCMYRYSALH